LQEGANAADTGWRDYFNEPRLQNLIAQALENNRDLRIAVLRVDEARAAYGITRAERWPTVSAQAGMDRSRTPASLSPVGQRQIGNEYQMALGVTSWEIDFWGRLRSLQHAALESFLATDETRRAVTISLIAQVALSDLGLRELDERIALARRTIDSRQESFRIFSRRVEVGSTSRLDLLQVQTLLTQAQALGAQLEQTRAEQLQALTFLVGAPLELPPVGQLLDEGPVLQDLPPGLPSDLLTQRPDIIAAEHQLKATHANIGAARAAFFPRVALTTSLGTASAELDGLFGAGSRTWSLSPSISLPLFDGGRRRSILSQTQVRRELAVANYERTVQAAFRDVADALSARRWLDEQVGLARNELTTQTERVRLSRMRYDSGATTFLEVLDAERDLLNAGQQLVQTRRALLANRVGLYAALGGGAMDFVPANVRGTSTP
jgi:multidrug efflux system outer membrane protein